MGQRTIYTDDISGKEIPDGEGGPIVFSLRDDFYRIDLSNDNIAKLEKALATYIEKAVSIENPAITEAMEEEPVRRRGRRATPGATTKTDPAQLAAMRTWLRAQGHTVGDKGRIAANLQELYHNAH